MTNPPFRLEGIDHVLLLVQGMEKALAFYEGVLGARIDSRLPQFGMVELSAGGSHIDIVDTTAPEGHWALPDVAGGRNVDHVALRIARHDESALRGHLTAHGISIVEERLEQDAQGRIVSFYVRDPSGNVIELIGRAGPSNR